MKFVTNLWKNKVIYLVLLILIVCFRLYYKYFRYQEGINGRVVCNNMNKTNCLSNAGYCDWNNKLQQCSNKHNCADIISKKS